jgi:phospholipid/cholesterol/gamma-HCH transport system substrate-binding protein
MKRFRERNRALSGLVGVGVTLVLIAGALEFPKLPLIHDIGTYDADFASAGGLTSGDIVTIHGVKVGTITGMALHGDRVRVTFTIRSGVHLGSNTTAAAKVLSPVGTEYMELSPSGHRVLGALIPLAHTSVPYNLVTDLSQLGTEIQQYNIPNLETQFNVGSQDLNGTTVSEMTQAFNGVARISRVIGNEHDALATIVTEGAHLTQVLSDRSQQLFHLFGQADLVLQVVRQRQAEVKQLLDGTAKLSQQITAILSVNRSQLTTLLDTLQTVSAVLAKDSNDFSRSIPVLAAFSRYAANSTGSGPFADVSLPTLLIPDNLIAQCGSSGAFPSNNPQVGCRP